MVARDCGVIARVCSYWNIITRHYSGDEGGIPGRRTKRWLHPLERLRSMTALRRIGGVILSDWNITWAPARSRESLNETRSFPARA